MDKEMATMHRMKQVVGTHHMYVIRYHLGGTIERLKTHLHCIWILEDKSTS